MNRMQQAALTDLCSRRSFLAGAATSVIAPVVASACPKSNAPQPIDRSKLTTGKLVREACRSGVLDGQTSGLAPGFAQANLVVLPRDLAYDFLLFCRRNPEALSFARRH